MNDRDTMAAQLEDLWVRTQCVELGARYCHGVDRADRDVFMSIWHPDGEYLVGRRVGRFAGHAELATALDFVREAYASTHHWTTNQVVRRISPETASGESDSFAICVDHQDKPVLVAATYDDEYCVVDGQWKIRRRVVRRWLVSEQIDVPLRHPEQGSERS